MLPKDLHTWSPLPQNIKHGLYTVEVPGAERVKGETIPRRNAKVAGGLLTTPDPSIKNVYDIVKYASRKYGNAKAIGSRKLVKTHVETKKVKKVVDGKEEMVDKKWTYPELSGYNYITFTEYEKMVNAFGAGLRKIGLNPDDRLQLFAATNPQWLTAAHGAASQSITIVTAYDSLGPDGLKHSMLQTGVKAIALDPQLLPKLEKPLMEVKTVKHIIYTTADEVKQSDIDAIRTAHPDLSIHSFDEVLKLGEETPTELVLPQPESICCIMYTSGSTGAPKGVKIKHSNVVSAVAGADTIYGEVIGPGDGLLTYLPLAHILEFIFENATLFWGGTMGYGNPRTLSDQSVKNCKGDIREFRPSILVGVPAIWESVKKGVIGKINAGSFVVRNLFWGAMYAKNFLCSTGLPGTGVLDAIVFNKIKDATGGKLRLCLNGGGPVSKETQHFISIAITPMLIGYGLTETCAMGALMDTMGWDLDSMGEMPGSIDIKLVDYPEAGYYATNNPPQGEIWIRGGPVVDGYLDLEKETKEAFTEDGWFKTGDIGEWSPKGEIRIVDRKKNLVKTLNGEYIALEKLESVYRSATVVANICVYAAADKDKPVAIIVPVEPVLKKLASEIGVQGDTVEELARQDKVINLVTKQLQDQGRKSGLSGIEIIDGVVIAEEEWTPQNGYTTSAMKLNRKVILEQWKSEVDKAYKMAGK